MHLDIDIRIEIIKVNTPQLVAGHAPRRLQFAFNF